MLFTNLNNVRKNNPCPESWAKFMAFCQSANQNYTFTDPLSYSTVLEANGYGDTLWVMRCEPQYDHKWRLFGAWCCRRVQHLISDQKFISTLDIVEQYSNGQATKDKMRSALLELRHRRPKPGCSPDACDTAEDAVRVVAGESAWNAARVGAYTAARAIGRAAGEAAGSSGKSAAREAALAAERAAQTTCLAHLFSTGELLPVDFDA